MSSSLLLSKLYFPPARPALVPRLRLLERLFLGLQGPLTLIAAPAGYGKTTLLSEWHSQAVENTPVAWLSLDGGDNDLARFLLYFIAAFDTVKPDLLQNTGLLLQSSQLPPVEAICTALINELIAFPSDLILVLDDYHVITTSEIHTALTFLLDHLPPHVHLAILTRADPPLPLARLRARGQLTEIRAADLRFTIEEASVFLKGIMGLDLSSQEVAALEKRTEGWIVGLQLAALSMQGRDDLEGFVAAFSGSHQYIVDYLAEEVLNRQTESVRDFLVKTSILERLTAPLCEALTGNEGGQATLEMLAASNLFLIPLDDERRWFRYHHLFGDLLRSRLKNLHPEEISNLHQRASAWFDQKQMLVEAIGHSFSIQEYDQAKRMLRKYFPGWMRSENRGIIRNLFQQFPADFLQAEPWLSVVYAWLVWGRGMMNEAETYLDHAQQAWNHLDATGQLPFGDVEYDGLPAEILAFRALIASQRDQPDQVIELANQSLAIVPEQAATVRAIAYLALQATYRNLGEMDITIDISSRCIPEALAGGETGLIVSSFQIYGVSLFIQGHLCRAAELYREALAHAVNRGQANYPQYCLIRIRLADIHYQWNQLDQAEDLLKQGLERADFVNNLWAMIFGRHLYCQILRARGEIQTARQKYAEIEPLLQKTAGAYYHRELSRISLLTRAKLGLTNRIENADQAIFDSLGNNPTTSQFEWALTQVQIQATLNQIEGLLESLFQLEKIANRRGHQTWLIQIFILEAITLKKQNPERALTCLVGALGLAEPEGYMRIFLDEGEPVRELLKGVRLKDGALYRYSQKLLAAFRESTPSQGSASQPQLNPLSERELEVLGLIAAGRSNKEIAGELVIAIGTVKRHTVNIFNKLDAQNRTEAVAKARELGLL